MPLLETLKGLTAPWAATFADHAALSTGIIAGHVLSIFAGGGIAMAADRRALQADANDAQARMTAALELASVHRLVIVALGFAAVTGVLLLASDIGTFAISRIFWAKMATLGILAANGVRLIRADGKLVRPRTAHGDSVSVVATVPVSTDVDRKTWTTVRSAARISVLAWCTIVVLGVVLGNA